MPLGGDAGDGDDLLAAPPSPGTPPTRTSTRSTGRSSRRPRATARDGGELPAVHRRSRVLRGRARRPPRRQGGAGGRARPLRGHGRRPGPRGTPRHRGAAGHRGGGPRGPSAPDDLDDAAQGLTLRGLVALADGVRESTVEAIAQLRASGVRVLVATGDHPETAAAIAAEAGIPDAHRVVTGAEFLRASDAERVRWCAETTVFARLSPEQKVALVAALRKAGATLAMTGDGVNDAAAIRLADVGVGVGGAGGAESPAARRSADLVLTDADLTRLVDAIAEGRAMWGTGPRRRRGTGRRERRRGRVHGGRHGAGRPVAAGHPPVAAGQPAHRHVPGAGGRGREPAPHRGPRRPTPTTRSPAIPSPRSCAPARSAASRRRSGGWCWSGARPRRRARRVRGRPAGSPVTRSRAGSMGLAALIGTQLAQTAWTGRRSPLVLVTAAGSFAVLVAVVQTPGREPVLRLPPARPVRLGDGARLVGRRRGGGGAGAAVAGLGPAGHLHATTPQEGGRPEPPVTPTGTGRGRRGADGGPGAGVTNGPSVPAGGPT